MLRSVLLAGALALACAAAPALAQQTPCVDLADAKKTILERGGRWIALTPEQWQFARGVAAEAPLTPTALPPGDRAALAQAPGDDGGIVLFVDGDKACAPLPFPANWVAMLRQVGAGEIKHIGTDN